LVTIGEGEVLLLLAGESTMAVSELFGGGGEMKAAAVIEGVGVAGGGVEEVAVTEGDGAAEGEVRAVAVTEGDGTARRKVEAVEVIEGDGTAAVKVEAASKDGAGAVEAAAAP